MMGGHGSWSSVGTPARKRWQCYHCGNGNGIGGDKLYSLREPIMKPHKTCWKPHLTFILREGLLGEMKGFANQNQALPIIVI